MKYVTFVVTDGPQPAEAVAEMNRRFPAYFAEIEPRGVRLFGRELDLPDTAVTVRRRDDETLVTDGPFAETKEFVGGLDVLDCVDLDEAIEVMGKSPVAPFLPLEIRPIVDGLRLGPGAEAFGREDDSDALPYLLMAWVDATPASSQDRQTLHQECDAWRDEQNASGAFVLGSTLGEPETATTMRFRDGEMRLSDGPFLDGAAFIAGIDIVRCTSREQAIDLAAAHPSARHHAIEARPFYSESFREDATG